ncbi:hypothetical protein B0H14DRAFT_3707134 [Mycena olivaceomarginata]|nr:hypothetical protein B0H14DRAFT_3707134 [Mycena olivaceomarginata]
MPFTPVALLDPERLKLAEQRLCEVFGIESLHPHQKEAGQNILKGISTFLDVPTVGGKTLAFWYALFYHWQPGNVKEDCQKIVLVVGPLVALMNEKGIPAIAITGNGPNLEKSLMDLGKNKYRVGLVGPEMVLGTQFHEKTSSTAYGNGRNDDFRPEYRQIVTLSARLPTGLPILGASATAPYHVIKDILESLGLLDDCARVEVSNEKLNVFLSVRILQHEPESLADLLVLFPDEGEGPEDFLQTLIYANSRQEVEKIQDFLRDNAPTYMDPKKAFEFYHRHIDDKQKEIHTATLLLWMKPRSFLSLVQKIGRCVRDLHLRGEAALYITKAMYTRCCAELEILKTEKEALEMEDSGAVSSDEEGPEEPRDRDEELALQDASDEEEDALPAPVKRRRKGKGKRKVLSPIEERDLRQVVEAIQEVLVDFPDLAALERESQAAERTQKTLDAAAFKELRSRLVKVFEGCYDAVFSEMEEEDAGEASTTRKRKKLKAPRRRCQIFLKLPRRNVWPDYHELIKEPISMANIKTLLEKATHYTSIAQYRSDWHLMFSNARQYNLDGSQVYEDAVHLQQIFDSKLYALSFEYKLPGYELLPALHKLRLP